jgi:hypothetical protein
MMSLAIYPSGKCILMALMREETKLPQRKEDNIALVGALKNLVLRFPVQQILYGLDGTVMYARRALRSRPREPFIRSSSKRKEAQKVKRGLTR